MKQSVCVAVTAWVVLSGCGGKKRAQLPTAARLGSTEQGIASWYGYPYHGRRAANGEIYDMEKMTAAHRTLPFGTWVRVKNLENDKTVDVRITDRGPFVRGRILDLSRAAAESIAMIGPGTAKVKITVIAASAVVQPAVIHTTAAPVPAPPAPLPQPPSAPVAVPAAELFAVQVGSFADRANADRIRTFMESRYGSARIVMRDGKPVRWRVLVGREETQEDAEVLAERIRGDAEVRADSAFVVRLDSDANADSL